MYVSKPITQQCKIRWNRYCRSFRCGYFYLPLPYLASLLPSPSPFDNNTSQYLLWQIIFFYQASQAHRIQAGHIILHLSFTRELLPTFCDVMCSYHIVHGLLLVFTLPYVFLTPPFVKGSCGPISKVHNLPNMAQQTVGLARMCTRTSIFEHLIQQRVLRTSVLTWQ